MANAVSIPFQLFSTRAWKCGFHLPTIFNRMQEACDQTVQEGLRVSSQREGEAYCSWAFTRLSSMRGYLSHSILGNVSLIKMYRQLLIEKLKGWSNNHAVKA